MSAQRGKDILLKIEDGGGNFSSVAGLRTRTMSLNAATVDITHAQSAGGWRELLADAGARQASVSGAGVFISGAAAETIRAAFFAGDIRRWEIVVPGLGRLKGPFQIANLDYAGDHDGEATMALALESAGALVFEPEA